MDRSDAAAPRCAVLGDLVLSIDGRSHHVGASRAGAVLATLLVDPGRAWSVDELVEVLWPGDAPRTAATMVHGAIRRLRTLADPDRGDRLGRLIQSRAGRYRVGPDVRVDAVEFERLLARGRDLIPSSPSGAAELLDEGLAPWRGEAFAGIDVVPVRAEAGRLDELRLQAVELLAEADLARGRPGAAVAALAPVVSAHPTRERTVSRLMTALCRSDRSSDALAVFREVRDVLVTDLGVDPGPELRALADAIHVGHEPAARGPAPLPRQLGAFEGRDDDLARLATMLADHRLVTLTGPGGAGKTRLAVEVARRVPGDVVFVDLSAATSVDRFDETVADAVGLRSADPHLAASVATALGGRPTLLVLDNAEHVLARCATFVGALTAAGGSVLTTSRSRLGLPGEQVHLLAPLPVPDRDTPVRDLRRSPAVRLFLARAREVRPAAELTDEGLTAVAEICRRLDGLPLALELAAARTGAISPVDLVARLDDRFRLLARNRAPESSPRTSLAATIAWSRDLLAELERRTFARVSVFPAGFDLEAVAAVAGGPTDDATLAMSGLVDASLVQVEDPDAASWRYRLLESTRWFARRELDPAEHAARQRRHAEHYLAVARRALPHLQRAGSGPWLDRLDTERDNLGAALTWAAGPTGDPDVLVGFAVALWHYWDVRGSRGDGLHWLTAALAAVDPGHPERMALLSARALLHLGRGEFEDTAAAAAEQLELARAAGDRRWEGDALAMRATVAWTHGQYDRSQQLYEDAVAASLAGADVWRAAMAEAQLARLHRDRDEPDAARLIARRSAGHADDVGEGLARGLARDVLASIEARWGDPRAARSLVEEALGHYRLVGYREGEASALALRGRLAAADDDRDGAREHLRAALDIHRRIGHRSGVATTLESLADIAEGS